MPLPTTNISMNDIHVELGSSSGTQVSLNDLDVRRDLTTDPTYAPSGINPTSQTEISIGLFRGAINAEWELNQTLINPNDDGSTNSSDNFGGDWGAGDRKRVAIDGTRAIVSAINEDNNGVTDSGIAYIYNISTGALLHTLDNPNASGGNVQDSFGDSVDILGSYAVVGAPKEDVGSTNRGSVYIYNASTGALLTTINGPSGSSGFGTSVALSQDSNGSNICVAIGDLTNLTGGRVHIYNVSGTSLRVINNPSSSTSGDNFGDNIDADGGYVNTGRLIVGAQNEDPGGISASGTVYIYNIFTGALIHTIDNPNLDSSTNTFDRFGCSVGISGDRAIIGSRGADDQGTNSGRAFIYNVSTGARIYTLNNPTAYGAVVSDDFGNAAAIEGDRAIIGAWSEDPDGISSSGAAYIFEVSTGNLVQSILNPNSGQATNSFDRFAASVDIYGDNFIVGAPGEDNSGTNNPLNGGRAYIYGKIT